MILKPQTIIWIQRAIFYGEEIKRLFMLIQKGENISPPSQNALIFCLKAIGACIDKAAESEQLSLEQKLRPNQQLPQDTIIFWKNMHYLRNHLIHHFDKNILHTFRLQVDELGVFTKICKNAGQIVFYLNLVTNQKKTSVDLGEQRFKVFLDIHEFSELLANHNPREIRTQITQPQYLQALVDAIGIIYKLIPDIPLDRPLCDILGVEYYYALQNILECIATLTNPNMFGATQRINDQSRSVIFRMAPQADNWLRGLGQSRIGALHSYGTIVIPDDEVRVHLRGLKLLHQTLLDPRFANTLGMPPLEDRLNRATPNERPPAAAPPM